jgi:peptide-methionine (S)-S-oxide reductase
MATTETATFGAGCFWGVQEEFRVIEGVTDTVVGYEGGHTEHPTYEQVSSHATGHAEVCQVTFDPSVVSYGKLLEKFWEIHDPTQMNRQGPDIGDNYRSVIFFHSPDQKVAAEKSKAALDASGKYDKPIATAVEPAQAFWRAEEYHQFYTKKTGRKVC